MTTLACRTGRHVWLDAINREHCCDGHRRELRIGTLEPDDDPALATPVRGLSVPAWWVWVDENEPAVEIPQ